MPSPLFADRPPGRPAGRGAVDAPASRARRSEGEGGAVRREAREGSPLGRVGSAEWNLLTGVADWSAALHRILGRDPAAPALTLDELPSVAHEEDRARLTAMVTGCLVDAKPVDGEFRVVRPDGTVRTVHMRSEPVLGADGGTASMRAVLRDVGARRRGRTALRETRDSPQRRRHPAQAGHRLAVEPRETAPPPWRGSPRLPHRGGPGLDLAARHFPAASGPVTGGDWYETLELPGGDTLLGVGHLTGGGPGAARLLSALRGTAGTGPGPALLLSRLPQLPGTAGRTGPVGAVCCRYRPAGRTLTWARTGLPAPLLFRDGRGRTLDTPDRVLPGAAPATGHGQAEETLRAGDLLLLHCGALGPGRDTTAAVTRLLDLAPRFASARSARDGVRTVLEEFGAAQREDDAGVLVARVTP
ncbi:SpoIIE family protein phosphatase [Streptomyces sp. NPDC006743]|uniref:PP2C family protein-serine/threonine phosphatase n=1 Tax=Streptomyces sp. NPDC006743 TaxID=3154480 RepID=UPI003453CA53